MKLFQLISKLEVKKIIGSSQIEVENIYCDSKAVTKNSIFICIKGNGCDGHDYVRQAENYGAVAIVSERAVETSLTQIIVDDCRKAMSILASEFYGNPQKNLKIIGVVGTNGKTTTTNMIYEILTDNGINTALIGTLGIKYGGQYFPSNLTTPDPLELYRFFNEMVNSKVEVVVMEVSAHSIYLDKVYRLKFDVGVFTNFTRDHLDFFGTMENYKKAKLKFFRENLKGFVVVNSDDKTGMEICKISSKVITYGIENPADNFAIEIESKNGRTNFVANLFDCILNVDLPFVGRYNVSNALASLSAACLIGVKPENAVISLKKITFIEGRLERIYSNDFDIYVDYAHTPNGLENVLKTLKEQCEGRLVLLFGCGGNRDEGKRREMGKIAGKYSDFTVITSDNPRFEEPMQIISEIEKGMLEVSKKYVLIESREEAIDYAIKYLKKDDVLLIAGKGGEKYQEILGIKLPYNDKDRVKEILQGNKIC